jgi:hypothetical protein
MAENEIGLKIKLMYGELDAGLAHSQASFKKFNNAVKSEFQSTKNMLTGKFSLLGGLVTGAAIYKTIKDVAAFDDSVRRLATDTDMTTAQMLAFKQKILDVGIETGVSTSSITELSKSAYEGSHNMQFVNKELAFMAKYAQATGAPVSEIGRAFGELSREMTPDKFESAMKFIYAFGETKGARMEAKEFLPQAGSLLKAASVYVKSGELKNVNTMMAEAQFSGSPRSVMLAYRTMHKYTKKELASIGITGATSLTEAMGMVLKKGGTRALVKMFGRNAVQSLQPLIVDAEGFNKSLEKASKNQEINTGNAKTFSAAMERLHATWLSIADTQLSGPIQDLSNWITKISTNGELKNWISEAKVNLAGLKAVVVDIGIAFAAWKIFKMGEAVYSAFSKKGKGGVSAGGIQQVYVVNMPGSGFGGPGGLPGKAAGGAGALGTAGKAWIASLGVSGISSILLPVTGMVVAAVYAHEQSMNRQLSEQARTADLNKGLTDPNRYNFTFDVTDDAKKLLTVKHIAKVSGKGQQGTPVDYAQVH